MKNITNEGLLEDLETVKSLLDKYSEAIWEGQCNQPAHFDNQQKIVRICMTDARCGLLLAKQAIERLCNSTVEEDKL